MKVYCVIVTYNGIQWIEKCFGSLRLAGLSATTIAVDNGSTDGTIEALESRYPEVEIVRPGENLGFGMGNAVGVKKALEKNADFIFLFNQDAYLLRGSLDDLLEAFNDDPRTGIVSPVHLAGDERSLDFGFYKYAHPDETPYLLGDIFGRGLQPLYRSKFINAAAWIMKVSMIKEIGFFHPIFDHYGEDREYASRMEKAGYKIFVYTPVVIVHDRPQHRINNSYYRYGKGLERKMMQALVEKKLTFRQVKITFFRHLIANLLTLNVKNAMLIYKSWAKVKGRKKFLSHTTFLH